MHEWGYAPTIEALSRDLLGGAVSAASLLRVIESTNAVLVEDGFVFLPGHERLLRESRDRVQSHRAFNGFAQTVAEQFAQAIARSCPLVDCIAVSGSVASGGYALRDDIDIDLFVRDCSKYLVYGIALLLALQMTIRHRRRFGYRKLICINVVWTEAESHPFIRQDQGLAFELLRCKPLLGEAFFRDVISANPWAGNFFPQLRERAASPRSPPRPNSLGRFVLWIFRHEGLLRGVDKSARLLTHAVYSVVHWHRRRDVTAMERLHFLQRVKYPYEVFQD